MAYTVTLRKDLRPYSEPICYICFPYNPKEEMDEKNEAPGIKHSDIFPTQ